MCATTTNRLPSGAALDFSGAALVMAIVNCTEDSFFEGSRTASAQDAVRRARQAEADGAAIIDFGAESSRPGARYVDADEEIRRLVPVIEAFRAQSSAVISVDTRKFDVARRALDAGADIINDISALEDAPEIARLCAERGAGIVLMHKKGVPLDMQEKPFYKDVVGEVCSYLDSAARRAVDAGVSPGRVILDPGIGFGKRVEDNLDLIARFDAVCALGYPTLMGLSRKSFIGAVTGRPVEERLAGTIAANAWALFKGAQIIRVHDVPEAVDLVKLAHALSRREPSCAAS